MILLDTNERRIKKKFKYGRKRENNNKNNNFTQTLVYLVLLRVTHWYSADIFLSHPPLRHTPKKNSISRILKFRLRGAASLEKEVDWSLKQFTFGRLRFIALSCRLPNGLTERIYNQRISKSQSDLKIFLCLQIGIGIDMEMKSTRDKKAKRGLECILIFCFCPYSLPEVYVHGTLR